MLKVILNTTSDGFILPMLAKVLKDNKPFLKTPFLGQYKINGVRCIISAQRTNDMFKPIKLVYHSREGTLWNQLSWMDDIILPNLYDELIDAMLDEGACLDGELYIPGQTVNNINSFVKNPTLPQHKLLQYWCYDVLIENMNAETRSNFRKENIKNQHSCELLCVVYVMLLCLNTNELMMVNLKLLILFLKELEKIYVN